ncbi:Gfo/Idh/MocA family protein [Planctomyces sp. SH-PL62]|uniref:Gfo/Idh/MocA family protein n=1 Tax=Planctomyces sp. SH-PL62 TaxID=1636152 RepID=UPI00078D389B|nr:Gfo/Idh/MocA family oxidoreductase [Planctomyces sp. SH-PL62]AMV37448.1 Inositol 2-dehydrogenase [Planctomyces sp. SH-PL62]
MNGDARTDRRGFLKGAGAGVAAGWAFPTILTGKGRAGGVAAGERIRLGFIGVGRQGTSNLRDFLKQEGVEVVALADVDSGHLADAARVVEKAGGKPATFGDYRKLLEDRSIDGVVVSTPDHWHALATADACVAGKDVYCEKPLSLTVAEGRRMVDVARAAGRVVQTGSQQRSEEGFRRACELVRNGRIGKVKEVRVLLPRVNFDGPAVADSTPPPELDYDFWLGPAPHRPYNAKRVHYLFRFFWDYSGGQMTNFGAHHLDIAQWGLGRDESGPVAVEATARFNKDGWFEVAETSRIVYTYDDGVRIVCLQGEGKGHSVQFEGEKGTIGVSRGSISADPKEILEDRPGEGDVHLYVSTNHHRNWLDCIKTREKPVCDVAIGHRSATVCHLGNIAIRAGRKIAWDPKAETIVGDDEAAAMLSRPYRAPWRLPESSSVKTRTDGPSRA